MPLASDQGTEPCVVVACLQRCMDILAPILRTWWAISHACILSPGQAPLRHSCESRNPGPCGGRQGHAEFDKMDLSQFLRAQECMPLALTRGRSLVGGRDGYTRDWPRVARSAKEKAQWRRLDPPPSFLRKQESRLRGRLQSYQEPVTRASQNRCQER